MKRLTPVSMHAVLLLSVLFLASCGGGDDGPTGPGSGGDGDGAAGGGSGGEQGAAGPGPAGRLDSRLFGTWIVQESWDGAASGSDTLTFRDDGSWITRGEEGTETGTWWAENGRLTIVYTSVFRYEISDGELTFTAVGEVYSVIGGYSFRADGNPRGLTGVTWVDGDGDELVFTSNGRYAWGGFEEGAWAVEGGTITLTEWVPLRV